MLSLVATSRVGQNSCPIFRHLWNKVHPVTLNFHGVIAVCNALFQLIIHNIVELWRYLRQSCKIPKLKSEALNFRELGPHHTRTPEHTQSRWVTNSLWWKVFILQVSFDDAVTDNNDNTNDVHVVWGQVRRFSQRYCHQQIVNKS